MDMLRTASEFRVLIIGAGSAGLLIAQRLKTLGICYTVFERDQYLGERSADWNFAVYWAHSALVKCLPSELRDQLHTAQTDPERHASPNDQLCILNSETMTVMKNMPVPNVMRYSRSKFQKLCMEGVNVEYGKRLASIICDDASTSVSAQFEDGSRVTGNLLIGADGARSRVRCEILDPKDGMLQDLPIIGCSAITNLPAEISKQLRAIDKNQFLGYHPCGLISFVSFHDLGDPERPETWQWYMNQTWSHPVDQDLPSNTEAEQIWEANANKTAEPLRSAFLSCPKATKSAIMRLGHWPSVSWGNRGGRVTLAGDAAHPMTYHRGQGLNNAMIDAENLCEALEAYAEGRKSLPEVISQYESEVVDRGRKAVELSTENSLMLLDWSRLKDSPMLKYGTSNVTK